MKTLELTKYQNRRLYDPELRSYVTSEHAGKAFDAGRPIRIRLHKGGRDVTVQVLLSLLADRVEAGTLVVTQERLRALVKS